MPVPRLTRRPGARAAAHLPRGGRLPATAGSVNLDAIDAIA